MRISRNLSGRNVLCVVCARKSITEPSIGPDSRRGTTSHFARDESHFVEQLGMECLSATLLTLFPPPSSNAMCTQGGRGRGTGIGSSLFLQSYSPITKLFQHARIYLYTPNRHHRHRPPALLSSPPVSPAIIQRSTRYTTTL